MIRASGKYDGVLPIIHVLRRTLLLVLLLVGTVLLSPVARGDSPVAPPRQYDLQNARIELRFDLSQKKVIGQVTHTLAVVQAGLRQLDFDSSELDIREVSVNGSGAHFSSDGSGLHVDLARPASAGTKFEVSIRYDGKPKKGLYFVFPDASNPRQTKQIWTQGEAEETRYYVPIYDYPNDRETVDMIVTVPRDWITVSNGTLESVVEAPGGEKTWKWRQAQPIASYLISLVAGEFDTRKETWRGISVEYHVPRGQSDRIEPTFARTRDMLSFFSDRLGVPYPWDKYHQTAVDQFVVGGMENVSATTLTAHGLLHPVLARDSLEGSDTLISHELSHQWFGDLVTCTDWSNLWLNEGFATYMAQIWEEHQYGVESAAYSRWRSKAAWLRQTRLFAVPIVTQDFDDSTAYAGNVYGKAALVLDMLRSQLGDEAFFGALRHYLEVNRLGNVRTSDLIQALEESTHTNLGSFFAQWISGAGAPRFVVSSIYDAASMQLRLNIKQTQEVRGAVGLFEVPVEVAVTTASGTRNVWLEISKADETFSIPVEGPPVMVLFDRGDKILKSVDFRKQPEEWVYQLKHAADVPDRASAAQALGSVKGSDLVVEALGAAAVEDHAWGVRIEALAALGRIGGALAGTKVRAAFTNSAPWVREAAVTQASHFSEGGLVASLNALARNDPAYRVRAAALASLGQMRAPGAHETLERAAKTNSPDDTIRRAALRAMGRLSDDSSVPTLMSFAKQGKPVSLRTVAIGSLARLDKKNQVLESQLITYLKDPNFDVRIAVVFALAERGDPAAIAPLEEQLRTGNPTLGADSMVKQQIERLRRSGSRREESDEPHS